MWKNNGTLIGHNSNNLDKRDNDDLEVYNSFVGGLIIAYIAKIELV